MSAIDALPVASQRVLGALMEKEMTTPDLYPLSLNSLIAASNQRSSRDPVLDLSEDEVRTALRILQDRELVAAARDTGRVSRFEHRARTVLNLRRDETAVLCLLLLRGPQTPGELRSRADRMFAFDDLPAVQATLDRLASREDPVVAALPRVPGSREIRFRHLLGAPPAVMASAPESLADRPADSPIPEVADLRATVEQLERRVAVLEAAFGVPGEAPPA